MTPGEDFDYIRRDEANALIDRVAESTRREFSQALTTVQVQVGAAEKTLSQKISSAKAWGIASLVGGQTIAAAVGAYFGPSHVVQTGARVLHHIF